jgi:hypothetical protein
MKKYFLTLGVVAMAFAMTSCGGDEATETTEETSTESTEESGGGLNDLLNNAVDQVQNEVNQQISDPNSELLQGIDTLKDIIEDNVPALIEEAQEKIGQ